MSEPSVSTETPAETVRRLVPLEVLRAAWDALPNIDDVKPEGLRAALCAALPFFEEHIRQQLGRQLDVLMNKSAGGCACPASSQRSCGYRHGVGLAADTVRGEATP